MNKTKLRKTQRSQRKSPVRSAPKARHYSDESQEIVLAIRRGKIDALVIEGAEGEQVLTLHSTEHPYRVLVETINEGVATLDPAGTILYANSRFAAILRVPAKKFIGTRLQDHVSSSDRELLQQLVIQGASASAQGEISLNVAEGRSRIIRLVLTPVKDSKHSTIWVVATELTELVEANEALKSNEKYLRQVSARLLQLQDEERRYIARDLHDVTGQKLAAQSLSLSQLQGHKSLGAEAQILLSECVILNRQVGEEIRTLSYLLHPPLLDELGLSSAAKWYAEGLEKRSGVRVEVDIAPDFPRLGADVEVTLFRIIQESLTNVHRYSGSKNAALRMRSTPENTIEVEIRDSGKGMNPETLNALTGTVAPIGVGIQGMKERMRQLSGKLEITSRVNRGTVVTATLPLSSIRVPAAIESISPAADRASERSMQEGDSSRKHILIADDHEMLRRGIRAVLETQPEWEVCGEAVNGQDAVDKASSLRPDLVILDITLPVLNGLVAIGQILRNSPGTKILVFTVHDSDRTAKEVRAAGAHGYLSKSNASDDLLRVVKNLLQDSAPSFAAGAASAN